MRKLLLPFTLLLLLFSCRTGDLRKEPWQEGMTVVTGLFKVDYREPISFEGYSVSLRLFLKGNGTEVEKTLNAKYSLPDRSFFIYNRYLPAGSYTLTGGQLTLAKNVDNRTVNRFIKFNFNYELTIEEGAINNLGLLTLSEEIESKSRYDLLLSNRGYDEVRSYYSSHFRVDNVFPDKWQNINFTKGEHIIDWSRLVETVPNMTVHKFDDLEITISYQAEAVIGEPIGYVISTKGKATTILDNIEIVPDMKHTHLQYTSTITKESMKYEVSAYRSYKLIPEKAGIYTINSKVVYREQIFTIPPVAITVKED